LKRYLPNVLTYRRRRKHGWIGYRNGDITNNTEVLGKLIAYFPLIQHEPHRKRHIQQFFYVRFEVLTATVMKSTVVWDITPYSPLKISRDFGGTHRFHLRGRIGRTRYLLSRWYSARLIGPRRWRQRRLTFNGLHGVISLEIVLFNSIVALCFRCRGNMFSKPLLSSVRVDNLSTNMTLLTSKLYFVNYLPNYYNEPPLYSDVICSKYSVLFFSCSSHAKKKNPSKSKVLGHKFYNVFASSCLLHCTGITNILSSGAE
jgi:hypothetical protein